MRRHWITLAFCLVLATASARAEEQPTEQQGSEAAAEEVTVFRPSTIETRLPGLSLAAVERFLREDGAKAVRLSFRFESRGRSLFVEHVPLFYDRGVDEKTGTRINIEVVLHRRMTPVRFVAIGRDGRSEAETWVMQVPDEDLPAAAPNSGTGENCPEIGALQCPKCPQPLTMPPYGKRISLVPFLFTGHHKGKDTNTGGEIDIELQPSFGIATSFGYPWGNSLDGVFELSAATYQLGAYPGGYLLDRAVSTISFGTGIRYYFGPSQGTYFELLWAYDRRFIIRAAGSGYYAAAPFDYPQFVSRFAATIIAPQRWGLVFEAEGKAAIPLWKSAVELKSGSGFDAKLYGVLKHPVARLRFGIGYGTESFKTDIVDVTNSRIKFEAGLDWSL